MGSFISHWPKERTSCMCCLSWATSCDFIVHKQLDICRETPTSCNLTISRSLGQRKDFKNIRTTCDKWTWPPASVFVQSKTVLKTWELVLVVWVVVSFTPGHLSDDLLTNYIKEDTCRVPCISSSACSPCCRCVWSLERGPPRYPAGSLASCHVGCGAHDSSSHTRPPNNS